MKVLTRRKASLAASLLLPPLGAALALLCAEWIHRGTLEGLWSEYVQYHMPAFGAAWLLLVLVYKLWEGVFHNHGPALLLTGAGVCLPAAITYFKLELRSEPLFPWDLTQVGEAVDVAGKAGLELQRPMAVTMAVFALLALALLFVPKARCGWKRRTAQILLPAAGAGALVWGVFLNPVASTGLLEVTPDMWNQARYYRNYGIVTAFLTNIQNLEIGEPEGYSRETVQELADATAKQAERRTTMFRGSYAASGQAVVEEPDIIYIMDESFWNAAELEALGVVFDQPVTPNLTALRSTAAYGKVYSPSFGGGTCDVEFEALTGYSMEFLPTGCKPYQQHVTDTMFSLPNYLKTKGYRTAAVHGYYKRFWSRSTAYPHLGIDSFIGQEDMLMPERKRNVFWKSGLVTDGEMSCQIQSLYGSLLEESDAPIFLHAVTMQNHTSYDAGNYPDEERVKVLEAPAGIDGKTLGALEDFATGVRDADRMLGELVEYFKASGRPVLLVFWGDHYNPIGSNLSVYTATGYAANDNRDPALHSMPLLVWSSYSTQPVEIGTVACYQIAPLVMELFGLEKPLFFEYLIQQMKYAYTSRTLGVTVDRYGSISQQLSEKQQTWFDNHWLLQYDLMFGEEYALGAQALRENSKGRQAE